MLVAEAIGLASAVPLSEWHLGFVALFFLAFLIFTARDVLFLQWCLLTRLKHPIMKGFLFLFLYYVAATIVGIMVAVFSSVAAPQVMTLLTAYALLQDLEAGPSAPPLILVSVVLQLSACGLILVAIQKRLARPLHTSVARVV
jgi:hypothetical protein